MKRIRRRLLCLLSLTLFGTAPGCAPTDPAPPPLDVEQGFQQEFKGGRFMTSRVAMSGSSVDVQTLLTAAATDLGHVVDGLSPGALAITNDGVIAGIRRDVRHISLEQHVDGVPIRGSQLQFVVSDQDAGATILASSYHIYQHPSVDTVPVVDRSRAVALATAQLRLAGNQVVREAELVVRPVEQTLRLVWDITADEHDSRALVLANGVDVGRVLIRDERVFDAAGVVKGYVSTSGAPGGAGGSSLVALSRLSIAAGDQQATTALDGTFSFAVDAGTNLSFNLSGEVADVRNRAGARLSLTAQARPDMSIALGLPAGEVSLAQVTAYVGVGRTRQFLQDNGFTNESFGAALQTNVNHSSTCNAYYSPSARTINFFRSGGGCNNSAETTIVAHEYGHFVDDLFGGMTNGGLSEGWGDVLACLMSKQPIVGGDLFNSGQYIRTCDNDYRYPADGVDEVHQLGQAWAGFVWHLRDELIAKYGDDEGDAMVRKLVLPALEANARDIPAAVRMAVLLDDDDDDLANKTPNWQVLYRAAKRHALEFVLEADSVAPAPIDDLEVTSVTPTTVSLRWTATGDDGSTGTAAQYDLRYASTPITKENFASAIRVPMPTPAPSGELQQTTFDVELLGTIHLAMRAADEAGQWSAITVSLAVEIPAPVVVYEYGAEAGLGDWQAEGLWHVTKRAAATGARSFWYGDEQTGTYDTGTSNSGVLSSPIIDLTGVDKPVLTFRERVRVESNPGYDVLRVDVIDVDSGSVLVRANKTTDSTGGAFLRRIIALDGLSGRRVRLRFSFDTRDKEVNNMEGWFVDDVRIIADAAPVGQGVLLINEVLADPPQDYDANGDGVYSARDDEFVELINVGDTALDLGGATIEDNVGPRFKFPATYALAAGDVLVVFGGGAPAPLGVDVLVAEGLFFNNGGDTVWIRDRTGQVLAKLVYGPEGGKNHSLVREVDGDKLAAFVDHHKLAGEPASPGTKSNGDPFSDETPTPPSTGKLLINEVLADPPAGFDANGDGVYNYHHDEFVELVNVGDAELDLGGATISDTVRVRAVLPDGFVLPAGQVLVVFGGGNPQLSIAGVTVIASSSALQLNNGGDSVVVRDREGTVMASMAYTDKGGRDQSLVRAVELDPWASWVLHTTAGTAAASPGLRADGTALATVLP